MNFFSMLGVPRLRGPKGQIPKVFGSYSTVSYWFSPPHGRGAAVGRSLGVGVGLGVVVAVGVAVGVGVASSWCRRRVAPDCAQYLPPVFKRPPPPAPPQTIISLPVQTAV